MPGQPQGGLQRRDGFAVLCVPKTLSLDHKEEGSSDKVCVPPGPPHRRSWRCLEACNLEHISAFRSTARGCSACKQPAGLNPFSSTPEPH